jgi:hypothetical protein
MNMKKGFVALLVMSVVSMDATYEINKVVVAEGLSTENAQAMYGKKGTKEHVPLTKHLQENSSQKIIDTQDQDSSVGKKSQGFNGFIVHDDQGGEYVVRFDWQNGYRLQAGRAKKTSVSIDLGKYDADPALSVARIELVKDREVLSSDVQNYKDVGTKFSIVLENNDGKYSVGLRAE